ncbi:MAG: TlpA disulfide reductase family protein [Rubripirellula sp.]|nr:TlpA disulfide reductase family protein [Rubripirellula sp.]
MQIFVAMVVLNTAVAFADEKERSNDYGILTLINGNSIQGRVVGSSDGQVIRWQADPFASPFDFRFSSVKSIKFPARDDRQTESPGLSPTSFTIELMNRDRVTGSLRHWDQSGVTVDAVELGEINLNQNAIRSVYRSKQNQQVVLADLAGKQNWQSADWKHRDWQIDGDHLWTQRKGADVTRELNIPGRALIDLVLSWSGRPNFKIELGELTSASERWQLSVSNEQLVANVGDSEQTVPLIDLRQVQSIRLAIAIDSLNGPLRFYGENGELLKSFSTRKGGANDQTIRIINDGDSLRVERFRVAQWRGPVPESLAGSVAIATANGAIVCGALTSLNTETQRIGLTETRKDALAMDEVIRIQTRLFATMPDQPQCALYLPNGQRLSGDLQSIDAASWNLTGRQWDGPVTVSKAIVRSMVVFNNDAVEINSDAPAGRPGRMEFDGHSLTGRLVPAVLEASENPDLEVEQADLITALKWHPFGAINSSHLKRSASGRIVYRDPPKLDATTLAAQAMEMQRQRLQQARRGMNFGELFLRRIDSVGSDVPERDAHIVHVRTGDAISCRVESIDQSGVRLSTIRSDGQFISHDQVKAIELGTHSPPPDLVQAKRDRLLTIPRLQKSFPPSHLLCSYNGDYLRCRVLEMDANRVLVEVQSKQLSLPRERIAQVIWFHEQESKADPPLPVVDSAAGEALQGKVQVLNRDQKRITFTAAEITANSVAGHSEIVGPCQFVMNDIDQLIFGEQIAIEVSDLPYNQWRLNPAVEPLVMQGMGSSVSSPTGESFVGETAPDVYLQQLDGKDFRLSDHRDRIVVLDFWASWCAPCMAMMPKIQALISDQDPNKVLLVSVNLEESAEHILGVMERQQLTSTVVMDVDSAAATKFNVKSMPQWFVIDREGKIAAVHAGAGAESLERLERAISDLLN